MIDCDVRVRKHVILLIGRTSIPASFCVVFWSRVLSSGLHRTWKENKGFEVLGFPPPVVSIVDPFPPGTGTWMNLRAAARSAWSCTISHRHLLASGAPICSSGMTTGATWRTILFANIPMVRKPSPSHMAEFSASSLTSCRLLFPRICYSGLWESLLQMHGWGIQSQFLTEAYS